QRAVMPYHAMARHDDGNPIVVIRHPHRSRGSRLSQLSGNLAVRAGLAIRNLQELAPDGYLKICPVEIQREIENGPPPLEVFLDLLDINAGRFRIENRALWNAPSKMDRSEPFSVGNERQLAQRRFDHRTFHA